MIDFLNRFFRREETSKNLAKERLRLVLMSDRVSLAPDAFDAMKGEMLDVVRRYLLIDEHGLDVHFENAERQFALMANIPVREVRNLAAEMNARRDHAAPANGADAALTPPPRRRRRRRRAASASSASAPANVLIESPEPAPPPEAAQSRPSAQARADEDAGGPPPTAG